MIQPTCISMDWFSIWNFQPCAFSWFFFWRRWKDVCWCARRSIFLSQVQQDLAGVWCHIGTCLYFIPTSLFYPTFNLVARWKIYWGAISLKYDDYSLIIKWGKFNLATLPPVLPHVLLIFSSVSIPSYPMHPMALPWPS